jgi:hypothetical protein
MCNARSNLISGKLFDLDRFPFASNLRKSHENTFNLLHTGGSKRKRGENHFRDYVGSFVEVPK